MSKRKFAVFDIDGTLIRWQLYHAIADSLVTLGHIDASKFQEIKDARMTWKRREHSESFREYELQLVQLFTNVMLEIDVKQFHEAVEVAYDEYKDQVYVYTRNLIRRLKTDSYLIFAISGSQVAVVKRMADYYGFDDFVGREDEEESGRFTGKSTTPVFSKDAALNILIEKNNAELAGSYGVGDSHSDIKMLEMVDSPIAFNPEKRLFDHAVGQGWKIVVERKNMVYELEKNGKGYTLVETES